MNIPFQSVLQPIKDIEERNQAFAKLSDEEKRKEIAYEAILSVLNKTFSAADGYYWKPELREAVENCSNSKELQLLLLHPGSLDCEVCQRGLMMAAQIRIGNSVDPTEFDVADICDGTYGRQGFGFISFSSMESEFESSDYDHPYNSNTDEKLVNISCNVIANGDFSVDDGTDYLIAWDIKL